MNSEYFDKREILAIKTKAGEWYRCGPNDEWWYIIVLKIWSGGGMGHITAPWFELHPRGDKGIKLINSESVAEIEYA